jgi:hypothetical protein
LLAPFIDISKNKKYHQVAYFTMLMPLTWESPYKHHALQSKHNTSPKLEVPRINEVKIIYL